MPPVVAAVAVYATSGMVASVIGSTVGQVVAGAMIGAVAGGATAAIMGEDIGEGALQGAISGLVVSGTSALLKTTTGIGAGAAESGQSAEGLADYGATVAAKAPTALWESTAGMTGAEIAGSVASAAPAAGKGLIEQGVTGAVSAASEPTSDIGKILAAQQKSAADVAKWSMLGEAAKGAVGGLIGTDEEDLLKKKYQYEAELADRERRAVGLKPEDLAKITPGYNKIITPFAARTQRIEDRYRK